MNSFGQRFDGPTAPGASATTGRRSRIEPVLFAPGFSLSRRNLQFGQWPIHRYFGVRRQGQRAAAVHHARQLPLAGSQVVEQKKACFADKSGAFGDAGKIGGERRLPGARHDERRAVAFAPKLRGQRFLLAERKPAARQVGDHGLAQAGHVIRQRRAERASPTYPQGDWESAAAVVSPPNDSGRSRRSTDRAQ